jgi:hypothetical protein
MMRDVTFPPVNKHHSASIQRNRLTGIQGSSHSPLMNKGAMSYSELLTELQGLEPEFFHVIRPYTDSEPESYRLNADPIAIR